VQLPEDLRSRFAQLERVSESGDVGAICLGLAALRCLAGTLVSDRLWDTPLWLRCSISFAGLGVLGWAVMGWSRNWIGGGAVSELANLVQRQFRTPRTVARNCGAGE
jgi:hypothetical protein